MSLSELKKQGIKKIYLNGFLESINYVINSVGEVYYTGETKSKDGYDIVHCFVTK